MSVLVEAAGLVCSSSGNEVMRLDLHWESVPCTAHLSSALQCKQVCFHSFRKEYSAFLLICFVSVTDLRRRRLVIVL